MQYLVAVIQHNTNHTYEEWDVSVYRELVKHRQITFAVFPSMTGAQVQYHNLCIPTVCTFYAYWLCVHCTIQFHSDI